MTLLSRCLDENLAISVLQNAACWTTAFLENKRSLAYVLSEAGRNGGYKAIRQASREYRRTLGVGGKTLSAYDGGKWGMGRHRALSLGSLLHIPPQPQNCCVNWLRHARPRGAESNAPAAFAGLRHLPDVPAPPAPTVLRYLP